MILVKDLGFQLPQYQELLSYSLIKFLAIEFRSSIIQPSIQHFPASFPKAFKFVLTTKFDLL